MPRETVEAAIAEHYRSLRPPDRFAAETRRLLEEVVTDEQTTVRQMHAGLNRKLTDLDAKESRLIDLLADNLMPTEKVHLKLIELRGQRKRIEAGIANTTDRRQGAGSYKSIMVDLAGRYAKRDDLRKLENLTAEIESSRTEARPHQRKTATPPQPAPRRNIQHRLPRHTIDALVQDYRDGTATLALAQRYGISKTAVLNLLTREGITRRHQPLTDAEIDHLERLYLAGHSLISCSRLTGTPASTIKDALHTRGTPMRLAGGTRNNRT
ncbi:hypothetical protein C5E45_19115 [Nocardia nova]|uniref:Uncharacterized protein n=1 Tax=Nocardia nova TaxID=37330 RepID=A0A2S6AMU0_9NOCA|nr:hypothetical protein C5E45_19115 [Nocardia nova]